MTRLRAVLARLRRRKPTVPRWLCPARKPGESPCFEPLPCRLHNVEGPIHGALVYGDSFLRAETDFTVHRDGRVIDNRTGQQVIP